MALNGPKYEVARANISHFSTQVKSSVDEQIIQGRIGSISVLDLTPQGLLYRERFVSSGHEPLIFCLDR
jgi:hypothetical protein